MRAETFVRKLIACALAGAVSMPLIFNPVCVRAAESEEKAVTLRVCNWEEYIDLGDWDETIDLESGDINGENSMVEDFEEW